MSHSRPRGPLRVAHLGTERPPEVALCTFPAGRRTHGYRKDQRLTGRPQPPAARDVHEQRVLIERLLHLLGGEGGSLNARWSSPRPWSRRLVQMIIGASDNR